MKKTIHVITAVSLAIGSLSLSAKEPGFKKPPLPFPEPIVESSVHTYCTGYNDSSYECNLYRNERYRSNQALLWKSMVYQREEVFSRSGDQQLGIK